MASFAGAYDEDDGDEVAAHLRRSRRIKEIKQKQVHEDEDDDEEIGKIEKHPKQPPTPLLPPRSTRRGGSVASKAVAKAPKSGASSSIVGEEGQVNTVWLADRKVRCAELARRLKGKAAKVKSAKCLYRHRGKMSREEVYLRREERLLRIIERRDALWRSKMRAEVESLKKKLGTDKAAPAPVRAPVVTRGKVKPRFGRPAPKPRAAPPAAAPAPPVAAPKAAPRSKPPVQASTPRGRAPKRGREPELPGGGGVGGSSFAPSSPPRSDMTIAPNSPPAPFVEFVGAPVGKGAKVPSGLWPWPTELMTRSRARTM